LEERRPHLRPPGRSLHQRPTAPKIRSLWRKASVDAIRWPCERAPPRPVYSTNASSRRRNALRLQVSESCRQYGTMVISRTSRVFCSCSASNPHAMRLPAPPAQSAPRNPAGQVDPPRSRKTQISTRPRRSPLSHGAALVRARWLRPCRYAPLHPSSPSNRRRGRAASVGWGIIIQSEAKSSSRLSQETICTPILWDIKETK